MKGGPRVVVGVTGSPANLAALHTAAQTARHWRRPLLAVFACPAFEDGSRRRCRARQPIAAQTATRLLSEVFVNGFGVLPTDIDLEFKVTRGEPVDVLLDTAWRPGDLLVIGESRGGLRRLRRPAVSDQCRARARQLIVVPRPPLLEALGHLRHLHDIRPLTHMSR